MRVQRDAAPLDAYNQRASRGHGAAAAEGAGQSAAVYMIDFAKALPSEGALLAGEEYVLTVQDKAVEPASVTFKVRGATEWTDVALRLRPRECAALHLAHLLLDVGVRRLQNIPHWRVHVRARAPARLKASGPAQQSACRRRVEKADPARAPAGVDAISRREPRTASKMEAR